MFVCVFATPAYTLFDPDSIKTPHAILMDADTNTVLWENSGARKKAYPASTTKVLTCMVVLDKIAAGEASFEDIVTVGPEIHQFSSKSSKMGLKEHEKIRLKDLLYGLMLCSGNDAAEVLAVHFAGSKEGFAEMMNTKAAQIGMKDSNFVEPSGVHDENHYTTAYDLALLSAYALKNETFRELVSTKTYTTAGTNKHSEGFKLENSNKLIYKKETDSNDYRYRYAIGIKTGDTKYAGLCLTAAATKDGVTLVAVLLGDEDNTNYRWTNAAGLFDYGFANYLSIPAAELNLPSTIDKAVSNCSLEDPGKGVLTLKADLEGKKIAGTRKFVEDVKANAASIVMTPAIDRALTAPIKQGDIVGTISYQYNGSTLFSANLVATRDVAELGAAASASPDSSPMVIGEILVQGEHDNSWLFWVLLAVLIAAIVLGIRLLFNRRFRRSSRRYHRHFVYRRR